MECPDSYERLEVRPNNIRTDSPDDIDSTVPPIDRKNFVYCALIMSGVGFVLPYNSFIIASDYWQSRFPGQSVALDMSMTYILVAFGTVLLNNVFLSIAPFKLRVTFGIYKITMHSIHSFILTIHEFNYRIRHLFYHINICRFM